MLKIDLIRQFSAKGMGVRASRFAMVIDDGTVTYGLSNCVRPAQSAPDYLSSHASVGVEPGSGVR